MQRFFVRFNSKDNFQLKLEGERSIPGAQSDSADLQRSVDLTFDPESDFDCEVKTTEVVEIVYDKQVGLEFFRLKLTICF